MRELSVQIKVYPISLSSENPYRFTADEFTFDPVLENSEAGMCYNCNKDLIVELPTKEILASFSSGRFAIVEFTDTRNRKVRIGTNKIPAIVYLSPNLNSATLKIECKMLNSPLL